MADTLTNGNLQNMHLFGLEAPLGRIEFLADCTYCHIIHANTVANHPTQLLRKLVINENKQDSISTFILMWNFLMVVTRSFPIKIPVCCPTGELNSTRYFFSSQCVSLLVGESMNKMLKEVNGHRFWVDQPSHIVNTFNRMHYLWVNTEETRKTR